jgi:hypothetical protein
VELALEFTGRTLSLSIADDGRGFDPDEMSGVPAGGHLGLQMLADMAADARGRLDVDSHPGRRTRVTLHVPVPVDSTRAVAPDTAGFSGLMHAGGHGHVARGRGAPRRLTLAGATLPWPARRRAEERAVTRAARFRGRRLAANGCRPS